MKSRIEAAIQTNLVRWIKDTHPDIKISAAQNENSRHQVGMGMDVGQPDLVLYHRRDGILHIFFLELKTKKGKLSKSQRSWAKHYEENMACNNTSYAVCYGFKASKDAISSWMVVQDSSGQEGA